MLDKEKAEKDYELEKVIGNEAYTLVKSGSRKRNLTKYKLEYARIALSL